MMGECQVKGCENEATVEVGVRLPAWINDDTFVPEEHRDSSVRLCSEHRNYLTEQALSGMSFSLDDPPLFTRRDL